MKPKATRIGETKKVVVVEDPYEAPEAPVEVPAEQPTEPVPEPAPANALALLRRIRRLRRRNEEIEVKLRSLVTQARAAGASWADIASVLGVARSSAWERFRDVDEEPARPDAPT
jgi:DNA-directed RNA polymerase specialized sigma24 family protein